nr:AAA family ATPase [Pseudomonas sp. MS15a(2019)]
MIHFLAKGVWLVKIRKLEIKNFRGIGAASIEIEDFTTFIGPNNIGKSTILHALHLLLDNKKPTIDDWPNKTQSDDVMEISCEFRDLEEWEKKKPAISGLLDGDSLKVRMEARWGESGITYEYSVYCTTEIYPWTDVNYSEAKKHEPLKSCLASLGVAKADEYKQRLPEIEQWFRDNHPECVQSKLDWTVKRFPNSLQQAVPHVMYVPACFKIEDDLKANSSSPFAFLFTNRIFPIVKNDAGYKEYIDKAAFLQKKLKGQSEDGAVMEGLGETLDKVSNTLNQILDFDSKVRLAIGEIEIEPLFMKAATFLIDEEFESSLAYQGSGVQRALAFAMLESNAAHAAAVEGGDRAVIVLYEEPELYIHPHLMRRLKHALVERTSSAKWQVVCSTHSPFLISLADKPKSLKLLRKDAQNKRLVYQLPDGVFEKSGEYDEREILRATLDFHPTVCESLFAKRVVLVEGATEVAVFQMAADLLEKLGLDSSMAKDTTIIAAGGKWTIPAIAKVLNSLGIEYRIIHDMDRKGLSDAELEELSPINPYRANKKIADVAAANKVFVVEDTFEHVIWDKEVGEVASSKDKPYNSWKRLRDYVDGKQNLTEASVQKLREILSFAFCA